MHLTESYFSENSWMLSDFTASLSNLFRTLVSVSERMVSRSSWGTSPRIANTSSNDDFIPFSMPLFSILSNASHIYSGTSLSSSITSYACVNLTSFVMASISAKTSRACTIFSLLGAYSRFFLICTRYSAMIRKSLCSMASCSSASFSEKPVVLKMV